MYDDGLELVLNNQQERREKGSVMSKKSLRRCGSLARKKRCASRSDGVAKFLCHLFDALFVVGAM